MISILNDKFAVVQSTAMPADRVVPWQVYLKRSTYLAQIVGGGQGEPFDVSGTDPSPEGKQVNL
jgi:hypothetical protein